MDEEENSDHEEEEEESLGKIYTRKGTLKVPSQLDMGIILIFR